MDARIYSDVTDLIGGTPMMRLDELSPPGGATILGKLESLNPSGSVKDRIAGSMIRDAEASGRLKPGMTVVEATSGNTGIGLAMLCAKSGYQLILTMPETMSFERRALVKRYGAQVFLTPGDEDLAGSVKKARQIVEQNSGCIELRQFDNPANPQIHRETTGPEILAATGGDIAAFVVGARFSIHCGPSEPRTMAPKLAKRPTNCGGSIALGRNTSHQIHAARPTIIASSPPCFVARFQNRPKASGTKAATSVTL